MTVPKPQKPDGLEPVQRADEEDCGGVSFLVLPHLDIGEAAVIVDADMDEVPARALEAFGAIAGDAVAGAPEVGQLLEVEMDRIARLAGMLQFQPAEAVASRQ